MVISERSVCGFDSSSRHFSLRPSFRIVIGRGNIGLAFDNTANDFDLFEFDC